MSIILTCRRRKRNRFVMAYLDGSLLLHRVLLLVLVKVIMCVKVLIRVLGIQILARMILILFNVSHL